ncbi:hypothetical protein EC968_005249 [Mortierella alpina]|nr:hypothetical protein EC968_005249 [Mortierella alpina]
MKAFTIVLGLIAAVAVSDAASFVDNRYDTALFNKKHPICGQRRAVRCIGLDGSKLQDDVSTMKTFTKTGPSEYCRCQKDKKHVYIAAEDVDKFRSVMVSCSRDWGDESYRGKTCIHH